MAFIISVSRRTDIPAFYSEWLKNRVRAGYCTVVNPFNRRVSRVSLKPEDVLCFVFWTKNPAPLLADEELFSILEHDYAFYFLFTLNGYPEELEPALYPRKNDILKTFALLSERVGSSRVVWRYDPIIISDITDFAWHRNNFSTLAESLQGKTRRVIVSVVDIYRTVARRFETLKKTRGISIRLKRELSASPQFRDLMKFMRAEASGRGMEIQKCCESLSLEDAGIPPGKCIDDILIGEILDAAPGRALREGNIYRKDPGQREGCLCTMSREIGAAHTCGHRCVYCYASPGDDQFLRTEKRLVPAGSHKEQMQDFHDPRSPSLCGWFEKEEESVKSVDKMV